MLITILLLILVQSELILITRIIIAGNKYNNNVDITTEISYNLN